jgi:UPF0716 protein FxsA
VPFLIIAFIVVPLLELWVIIEIGGVIGTLPTIVLLLISSLVGAALTRSQGRVAWQRFNDALAERRVPGREVFDGAAVIVGGALLLTPGFITDLVGIFFLAPPTRAAMRRVLAGRLKRRARFGEPVFAWATGRRWGAPAGGAGPGAGAGPNGAPPPGARAPRGHFDVEGTAEEVTHSPGELPGSAEPRASERGG